VLGSLASVFFFISDNLFAEAGFRFFSHSTVLCVEDYKTPQETAASAKWRIRQGTKTRKEEKQSNGRRKRRAHYEMKLNGAD
jgi:hypothetical protein